MAAGSFVIALYLRLDDEFWSYLTPQDLAVSTAIFTIIAAPVYWSQGMYRSVWRYASLRDLFAIFRAVTLTLLIFLAVMFLLTRLESVPRSTLVINWFVQLFMLGRRGSCTVYSRTAPSECSLSATSESQCF